MPPPNLVFSFTFSFLFLSPLLSLLFLLLLHRLLFHPPSFPHLSVIGVTIYLCRRSASKSLTSAPGNTIPTSDGIATQTYNNPAFNSYPSAQAYPSGQGSPTSHADSAAQPYPAAQPYSLSDKVTWTTATNGQNMWYVSSTGETQWTLPPGAILRS